MQAIGRQSNLPALRSQTVPAAPPVPLAQLPWQESAAAVFGELVHLREPLFLDTAGNFPQDCADPISIIAANPSEITTGSLLDQQDLAHLETLLARDQVTLPKHSLPLGGWFGTVDYDGSYRFGLYQNLLIHHEVTGEWWEVGAPGLSTLRKRSPSTETPQFGRWQANFTQQEFEERVAAAQAYIAAGDVYQINLSQRFLTTIAGQGTLWPLYQRLRRNSPAPMAGYLRVGEREILSTSPELFLKFSQGHIETRPIKGTRPRYQDHEADIRSSHELQTSEKERAELLMITDLLRSDLGQVCQFGTVQVEALARLESLAQVHHLVSTVSGTLREGVSQVTALAACLPGGSITGAPKKRATEIIAELETLPRGLYTGLIGYFGLNGESQFNIAIRTLIREGDLAHYHVGSGIVADSIPALEYEETLQKAGGLRATVEE